MIRVNLSQAELAAKSRPAGYMAELLAAGEVDGEFVVMSDEAYDRMLLRFSGLVRPCGPGCQLRRSLSWFVRDDGSCGCSDYAAMMDAWGPDESWKRLEEIVEHLRQAAAEKGFPFLATAARIMVGRAIEAARKEVAHGQVVTEEEAWTNLVRAR